MVQVQSFASVGLGLNRVEGLWETSESHVF